MRLQPETSAAENGGSHPGTLPAVSPNGDAAVEAVPARDDVVVAVDEFSVSVVLPCLNERAGVVACIAEAQAALSEAGLTGEILVVDNGSTDGSGELAKAAGARVVEEPRRGYGQAYRTGFEAARGRFIVMGDADGTYDFGDIGRFIGGLQDGADLVMGSRLKGQIDPGAMNWLHRYIGNPFLTRVLNFLFGTRVSDSHCGMRAFRREQLPELALRSTGMELASEQLVRSGKLGLTITEIPIEYRARVGESKLATFPDGWRHLRLLFAHVSPERIFVPAGIVLLVTAAVATGVIAGLYV